MTSSQTFDFEPTTRVVCGPNAIERLGELTQELGGRRVLVVTDPGIVKAGHVEKAVKALEAVAVGSFVFEGVEENPTTRHVQAGVEFALRNKPIDLIIGLGGGSSMDCAKGVNFLLTNGGKMEDYWGIGRANRPMLPSIGAPTTAGTGSESQSFALIAKPATHEKMACGDKNARFRTVVLDPLLLLSVPKRVAAIAGMDAISHAIESYVSTKSNPISRMFSKEAWRLLAANYEKVLQTSNALEPWGNMQLGAHFAGLAIENSMLGAAHACANPLTAHYGITHGIAVSLMLPHVIRFNEQASNGSFDELVALAGQHEGTDKSGAFELARIVASFREVSQLPGRLRDCGVDEPSLKELAKEAAQQWTGKFNPRAVDEMQLLNIYQEAY